MADTEELLDWARRIWNGTPTMTLQTIVAAHGKVHGDICEVARTMDESALLDEAALAKELGNLILSAIRWADDLGLDIDECIQLAKDAQYRYATRLRRNADLT